MAEFTLREILAATGGASAGDADLSFTGVSTDTRTIQPGNLFIALTGEKFDGHDYVFTAVAKGAAAAVVSRELALPAGALGITVKDTRRALQDIAKFHRQRFSVPVIAVTGSNGKTTTKDMIAAVLSAKLRVLKTEANFNNEIGLPQTLLRLDASHEAAIVEMGMRGRGEIRELAEIALPTIGVVTTVGETHIELLGSIENIAAAKAELVEAIAADGTVVLNADNSYVRAMRQKTLAKAVLYGIEAPADILAEKITKAGSGMAFECNCGEMRFSVELPTFGRHNIYNALAAIAVGQELGLNFDEIRQGLASFVPDAMRLCVETIGRYTVINDSYNASPLSMSASIATLRDIADGRTVAVLGDMLELGDIAIEAHQKIGKELVANKIDVVVTVGNLAEHIARAVDTSNSAVFACSDHDSARLILRQVLKPGDTILLKGSRGMKMEQLLDVFV